MLPDGGIFSILDTGVEFGEDWLDAGMDDHQLAESSGSLEAHRAVWVVESFYEGSLQLR